MHVSEQFVFSSYRYETKSELPIYWHAYRIHCKQNENKNGIARYASANGMHIKSFQIRSIFFLRAQAYTTRLHQQLSHTLNGWATIYFYYLKFIIQRCSLQYIQSKCKRDSGINTEMYAGDLDPKHTAKYIKICVFTNQRQQQQQLYIPIITHTKRNNKIETSFFCERYNII